ncbi:hypothetical protein QAD02_005360 [Eretmocerus hayati]|uniref:Uncharacterized protein n=1 Tax=Eretmocerus hayati TaxID=131215 RepID=A0ACC2NTA5_9HYME|nr:hypothetical protein QAD02_005360 [Eretmocerus hayati]
MERVPCTVFRYSLKNEPSESDINKKVLEKTNYAFLAEYLNPRYDMICDVMYNDLGNSKYDVDELLNEKKCPARKPHEEEQEYVKKFFEFKCTQAIVNRKSFYVRAVIIPAGSLHM